MWFLTLSLLALVLPATSLADPVRREAAAATNSAPIQTQTGIPCSCDNFYVTVSGDTCESIVAKYNNAFTLDQFYSWNPAVGSSCSGLWLGYGVCVGVTADGSCYSTTTQAPVPSSTPVSSSSGLCAITATNSGPAPEQSGIAWNCNSYHEVIAGDSCSSIVSQYNNFTIDQFYSWNTQVGTDCANLWGGYYTCIGINAGQQVSCIPTTTTAAPSSSKLAPITTGTWSAITTRPIDPQATPTIFPANGAPSAVQAGIQPGCITFYQAVEGDNCTSITNYFFGFNEAQFISWNPAVGSNCGNLVVGDYYCVQPGSYSPGPTVYSGSDAPSPLPNCIIEGCEAWYMAQVNDTCSSIPGTFGYNFSLTDFQMWNPNIVNMTNCTGFETGSYYCVNWPGSADLPSMSDDTTIYANDTDIPLFFGFPNTTCTIATANITASSTSSIPFPSGNSSVTSTGSMSVTSTGNTSATSTGSVSMTSTGSVSATSAVPLTSVISGSTTWTSAPQPEQTGIVSNCNNYHLVGAGDTCVSIESTYGLSSAEFYALNPATGSDCTNLWTGYYCCVGASGSPSSALSSTTQAPSTTTTPPPSTTASAVSTPSPVQTGMAANCDAFYLVSSGDQCGSIVTKFGNFTIDQFYAWNPAVGTSCADLFLGYYVCIGTQ